MQASSWHKLFHFHLLFWIWKVWKGRGKITKIWISQEWKELFQWNKKHFWVFEGLSFGEIIKIWWKIADTSLIKTFFPWTWKSPKNDYCLPGKGYILHPQVIYLHFLSEKSCSELIFIFSHQNLYLHNNFNQKIAHKVV